jgi:hypothetical protein
LPTIVEPSRQARLRRVIGGFERTLARAAGPLARQQAPADAEKDDADDRQTSADRQIVEHPERLAGYLAANPRDDDVGRGADQRREAAEQRAERQRHQQPQVLVRFAVCNAIGRKIASAPTFLMKADRKVTAETSIGN